MGSFVALVKLIPYPLRRRYFASFNKEAKMCNPTSVESQVDGVHVLVIPLRSEKEERITTLEKGIMEDQQGADEMPAEL